MKIGDYIFTPRFLTVEIKAIYDDPAKGRQDGYYEPTHYNGDENYDVLGKHTGLNLMQFAAVRKC